MTYRSAADILEEADRRGMRRAFVVTAMMLEMEAVQSHIDHLGSVSGEDGAVYECGVFTDLGQEWLVIVTETGEGTHAALSAVSYAHRAFAPFDAMILVGVGGSRKEEAPIGSVGASEHVYMPYSAKYGPKGRSSRPRSFQPDSRLIGIAKKVRREKKGWPSRIRDPLDCVLPPRDAYPVDYPPVHRIVLAGGRTLYRRAFAIPVRYQRYQKAAFQLPGAFEHSSGSLSKH